MVFVRGVVTEQGTVKGLVAMASPPEALARAAIEALQNWEFVPAQFNGTPVASKVLIGVTVTPPQF